MRVLLVLPDPPLPFGVAAARHSSVLLRGLVDRGHVVTAFAPLRQEADRIACKEEYDERFDLRLFPIVRGRRRLSLSHPFGVHFSADLRNALAREMADGYDVLHLETLSTAFLGHAPRSVLNLHNHYATDLAGLRCSPFQRFVRQRLGWTEASLIRKAPKIATLTERLVAKARVKPGQFAGVVPLGLNLDRYPFNCDDTAARVLAVGNRLCEVRR